MELKARQRLWQQIIPVQAVCDDAIISRRGEITVGWELSLPAAYSLSEQEYDSMLLRYYEAVRRLPAWTVVHRQDLYLFRRWSAKKQERWKKSFLEASYDSHFQGRRYLEHRAFVYLTLASKSSLSRKGSDSAYFGLRFSSDMPSVEKIQQFLSQATEFISAAFDPSLVGVRRLTSEDLEGSGDRVGLIQTIASLGDESPIMSDYDEGRDYVQYNGRRAISYSISSSTDMPTEVLSTSDGGAAGLTLGYAARLGVLLPCEHIVNHYIIVPRQDEILQELESRRSRMMSGITSSDNRVNAREIEEYTDDVNRLGLFTVRGSVSVVAWDSADRTEQLRSLVSAAISSMKIRAVANALNTPILFYAGIPGGEAELGAENYMPMELLSSLCLSMWESFDRGEGSGMLRLVDRLRHIPLQLDTQVEALSKQLITNYNACVLGASGSGKSFFMNMYLRNCYDAGEHVCVIDVGDSYEGLSALVREESGGRDGVYLTWDADHPFSFNPFVGMRGDGTPQCPGFLTREGTVRQDENGVNFILSFLMTAYSPPQGWVEQNSTILVSMLERFLVDYAGRESSALPVFDDFYQYLCDEVAPRICFRSVYEEAQGEQTPPQERSSRKALQAEEERSKGYFIRSVRITPDVFNIQDFILALEPYSRDGRFGFLLNNPSPGDLFSSRFTVFEVEALTNVKNPTFYSLCVLCIMNAFEEKMRRESAFKVLVIDEAWKAIANRTMAPYLASLWKTSRKFRVSGMVVTQQVSDILSSEVIRDTLLQNSAVKILLDQKSNRGLFSELAGTLSLSERDCALALSVGSCIDPRYGKYREVFVKLGDSRSAVYAVEGSAEELLCYESDKVAKQPFIALARQVGYREAARQLASSQNVNKDK